VRAAGRWELQHDRRRAETQVAPDDVELHR